MGPPSSLLGLSCFLAIFLYSAWAGAAFPKLPTLPLILLELAILAFCEFGPLTDFGARKLCHSLSGLLMLHLHPGDPMARYFVYSVAVSSLAMVWQLGTTYTFRFSRTRDVGITVYLLLVTAFFYFQLPLEIIKPVFFADPMGAVVGRHLTSQGWPNPPWVGSKTVGGSLAVLAATLATLSFASMPVKVCISVVVAVAEGLSKDYDNLFIAAIVIASYALLA